MNSKCPVSVLVIACLYIAVGAIGFVAHFHDLHQPDGKWIELTEFLALLAGLFMLRGHNWARWLAVAWMAYHVVLSAFHSLSQTLAHSLFLLVILATSVWAGHQSGALGQDAADILCQDLARKLTGRRPSDGYFRAVTKLGETVEAGGFEAIAGVDQGEILMRY